MTLDQPKLKDILDYDPATGIFRWRIYRAQRAKVGDPAGHRNIQIGGRQYSTSRLAWLYMTGKWPDGIVKHHNGDLADNRWINLYEATWSESVADSWRRRAA